MRDKFLTVLEDHKGIIYKIANSYCSNPEERKDLVQEIIIQLWTSFGGYDSRFKYSTWIYRIALNTSISYYRKNRKRNDSTVSLSSAIEATTDDSYESNQNEEIRNLELLQQFIRELNNFDRALILLHLDGLNQKDISEITGITQTNVSTKISRIKKRLKKYFIMIKN